MDAHMTSVNRSFVSVSSRYHHNPSLLISNQALISSSQYLKVQQVTTNSTISSFNSNNTHNIISREKERNLSKKTNFKDEKQEHMRTRLYEERVRQSFDAYTTPRDQTWILKEAPTWQEALSLFRYFQANQDYKPNLFHYNVVLRILGRARCWYQLKLLWYEMNEKNVTPTEFTYAILIDVYGRAGFRTEALQWLKCMIEKGLMPNEVVATSVIHMYVGAEEFDEAVEFYKGWIKSGLGKLRDVSAYNMLIDMYGKAGRVAEASQTFSEMLKSGMYPDNTTFNIMICICGNNGGLEEAMLLMKKMEDLGFKPNIFNYNTIIGLHAEKGNVDMALDYLSRMKHNRVRPDDCTYRSLLLPLCANHMIREVESILNKMGDDLMIRGGWLSAFVVGMYVEKGLVIEAWDWFETFNHMGGISSKSYAAIIDVFGEHGHWLQAEKVFCCTEEKHSVLEYNVMIKAYGVAEQYDKARDLFESMEIYGLVPDEFTYNSFIQMLAVTDSVDDARCYMIKMQEAGFLPTCQTYTAVISASGRLGRPVEAEMIYKEMINMGIEPNIVTYGSLVNAFAEIGHVEEAVHYFDIMVEAGIAGNSAVYRPLIKGYGKVGWLEGVHDAYRKMRELGDYPDVYATNWLIHLYSEVGAIGEAEWIFNDLKKAGRANEVSFATVLVMYKKISRFDLALNIAKEIQDSGLVTLQFTFNSILGLYSTESRLKEAAEVYQQMLEAGILPDDYTYSILCTILKKGGIPTETADQLKIGRESGIPHSKQAIIAGLYSVAGMHGEALEACEQLIDTSLDLDASVYNVVIYALGSAGRTDEAFKMFMRMQTKGLEPDIGTFTSMIVSYAKAGLVQGVTRMVNQMRYRGFRLNKKVYQTMIGAYESVSNDKLARQATQEMRLAENLQEQYDITEADDPFVSKNGGNPTFEESEEEEEERIDFDDEEEDMLEHVLAEKSEASLHGSLLHK